MVDWDLMCLVRVWCGRLGSDMVSLTSDMAAWDLMCLVKGLML